MYTILYYTYNTYCIYIYIYFSLIPQAKFTMHASAEIPRWYTLAEKRMADATMVSLTQPSWMVHDVDLLGTYQHGKK